MTNTTYATIYKSLTITFWKVKGVINDQNLLPEFLAELRIHIGLINETHLEPTKKWCIQI
jgi:hypothetical protein